MGLMKEIYLEMLNRDFQGTPQDFMLVWFKENNIENKKRKMPRNTYTKKINEFELDIEYNYVPAEEATHDYPGTGSTVEVEAIYLWNNDINVSTDEQVDMSGFFYELCPEVMYEIEREITEEHENS